MRLGGRSLGNKGYDRAKALVLNGLSAAATLPRCASSPCSWRGSAQSPFSITEDRP